MFSINVFKGAMPVYDAQGHIESLKQYAQMAETYQQLKKSYETLQAQLKRAEAQYKLLQEQGRLIGKPVALVRDEIKWWKKEIENTKDEMIKITNLYYNLPNEMKKMFDINSEYYHSENGIGDKDRAMRLVKYIYGINDEKFDKAKFEKKLNKSIISNKDITDKHTEYLINKDINRGKDKDKARQVNKLAQLRIKRALDAQQKAWGDEIAGKMFANRINELTEKSLKEQEKNIKKIIRYKEYIDKDDQDMIGHARTQNLILLDILKLIKENIENAKQYRTASLLHMYNIRGSNTFANATANTLKVIGTTDKWKTSEWKALEKKSINIMDAYEKALDKE